MTKYVSLVCAGLLLLFQLLFQVHLAKTDAQTTDEAIHLYAGYTYLTRHQFDFNSEHPPLVKLLAALPLLALHPHDVTATDYWQKAQNYFYHGPKDHRSIGEQFFYGVGNNPDQLLFFGRLAMVLLTLLLGFAIYSISVYFWGWRGGLLPLVLYVFDPTIAAHGHLITTDIGASLGYLVTIVALWRFLQKPSRNTTIILGIALGFALLTKFTTIILLPMIALLVIWFWLFRKGSLKRFKGYIPKFIAVAIIAWFTVLAGYFFKIQPPPAVQSLQRTIEAVNPLQKEIINPKPDKPFQTTVYNAARFLLIPRDYFKGLALVLTHAKYGDASFLLGKRSLEGWWYYFPVLFSAKTPIPTLIVVAMGIAVALSAKRKDPKVVFLLLATVGYLGFAMFSRANIGLRHILPIYPLLFVLSGTLAIAKNQWLKITIPIILSVFLVIEFVRSYPYYLSYFNQLYGGTENGYAIATDSNIEWGQDLKRIKSYIDSHNLDKPYLEYYWDGLSSVNYYGINSKFLSDFRSGDSGYIIIGASALQTERYSWLKNYQPIDKITPSVFIYKL
ncbi:MAG: glycosyltransferase family 39 protein [Patescibacteria group bacterium]